MKDIGFNAVKPRIERISFRKAGYITLELADGRIVSVPLTHFPGIERLTTAERRQYHVADEEFILFGRDDKVYHIQDFLGTSETNAYGSLRRQPNRRTKTKTEIENFLKTKGLSFAPQMDDKKDVEVKTTFA